MPGNSLLVALRGSVAKTMQTPSFYTGVGGQIFRGIEFYVWGLVCDHSIAPATRKLTSTVGGPWKGTTLGSIAIPY